MSTITSISSALLLLGSVLLASACGGGSEDTVEDGSDTSDSINLLTPPPAPGSIIGTAASVDGLWDASSQASNGATQYWSLNSNNTSWTTYLLDPITNSENCFQVTLSGYTEPTPGQFLFAVDQALPFDAVDRSISLGISNDILNATYRLTDNPSNVVTTTHSRVSGIQVTDLSVCQ